MRIGHANMSVEFTFPAYMERNRAFKVKCPTCEAMPMTRCYDARCNNGFGGYMDGYTHVSREKEANDLAREAQEKRRTAVNNPNCSGAGPHANSEVRILPHGKEPLHGNDILCRACFYREIAYRTDWNKYMCGSDNFNRRDIPDWNDLKVYDPEGE